PWYDELNCRVIGPRTWVRSIVGEARVPSAIVWPPPAATSWPGPKKKRPSGDRTHRPAESVEVKPAALVVKSAPNRSRLLPPAVCLQPAGCTWATVYVPGVRPVNWYFP